MKKTLQVANIVALLVTIVMNYLSNTGFFNNSTMATVSARYQNLFTPAGYAFSIWGLIYIGLIAFAIRQSQGLFNTKPVREVVEKIGWMFVISCIANCLWILAWLYDYTGASVVIMIVLLTSLCSIVLRTRMELDLIFFRKIALECWPFALYLGWICVAIIANIAAYLTKIKWEGFGLSAASWTIIMIAAATLINLLLIWQRNLRESATAGIWALIAVAVANWEVDKPIAYTALAAAGIIFLNCGLQAFKNKGKAFIIG
jgi:hypothetical protein